MRVLASSMGSKWMKKLVLNGSRFPLFEYSEYQSLKGPVSNSLGARRFSNPCVAYQSDVVVGLGFDLALRQEPVVFES